MIKNSWLTRALFGVFSVMLILASFQLDSKSVQAQASEYYSSGKAAIVLDATSKRIFYEKNADIQLPMASTTKIITAITVLDHCASLDEEVKVNDKAIGVEGTSIYLEKGEVLSVRELLYGLMLRSGNDAAIALAYHVSGELEEFCELMKQVSIKAGASKLIGFKNPHGLDADGHNVSARDLALITAYALENDDFREIVSTKSVKTGDAEGRKVRYLANKNRLLSSLEGCIGVKTGFTSRAGRCLVSAAERDGFRLVSVVFNCGPMFEESANLINNVYKNYRLAPILEPYSYVNSVDVSNAENVKVKLYTKNGFYYPLSESEFANLNYAYTLPEELEAPIEKDIEVGKLELYLGKKLLFSENIYTMEEVKATNFKDKVKEILDNWAA